MSTNKKNDEFGDGDVPLMMVLMVVVLEAMLFSKKTLIFGAVSLNYS